jgi:carboxymethylenebutenolidase
MSALREGPYYDVSVVDRTLIVDGVEVQAVHARPDGMPIAGVVLHPDVGGLRPLFSDMARRLATHGFAVLVFEPFAAVSADARSSVERRMASVKELDDGFQMELFSTAADLLVVDDDVARVTTLGFCMGGHYVFKAASIDRFDAAVAFYGMLRTPDGWVGLGHRIEPLAVAMQMCPTLAIFGTEDSFVPNADVDALRRAWAGRDDCEIVVVEGAEHGFVHDPERDVHRPEDASTAWETTLAWLTQCPN